MNVQDACAFGPTVTENLVGPPALEISAAPDAHSFDVFQLQCAIDLNDHIPTWEDAHPNWGGYQTKQERTVRQCDAVAAPSNSGNHRTIRQERRSEIHSRPGHIKNWATKRGGAEKRSRGTHRRASITGRPSGADLATRHPD